MIEHPADVGTLIDPKAGDHRLAGVLHRFRHALHLVPREMDGVALVFDVDGDEHSLADAAHVTSAQHL
jgi:hypothetical protein